MRVAIPAWDGRVSPVLDVARELRIFDLDPERGVARGVGSRRLPDGRAASTVADIGVDRLICSAVSPQLEAVLLMAGVEVVTDVCGDLEEIVAAVANGDTELSRFRMPGASRGERRGVADGAGRDGRDP
ncbi:MAG TPA: NifB/NifX family molybdenum-iron cluster-binding protein, partial [Candidatus Sulfomarinibacteraceae bacterium]|nr:NifB/NifX family molybdenum-iron cluster-binding protein [Candidatus Sulfomarinibacteraceae bacterium]